jgi:hypothetical protein
MKGKDHPFLTKNFKLSTVMKKGLLILLCCFWEAFSLRAQERSIKYKTVSLYEEQTFYLNGGVKATVEGRSRVTYKIELPANTVEWYYSITVERNETNNIEAVNLLSQLTRLIDKTGISSIVASSLLTPTGSGACDAYLISNENVGAFIAKRQFHYDFNHSVLNYKNGVVRVTMKPGYLNDFYIGFKNSNSMEGVTVRFSAVAILSEKSMDISTEVFSTTAVEDQKTWSRDDKNRIYNNIEKGVIRYCTKNEIEAYTEADIKSIAACFTDAIAKNNKEVFREMAEYEQERLLSEIISNCPKCTGLPYSIFDKAVER